MKAYFKYFRFLFIFITVLAAIFCILFGFRKQTTKERTNKECTTTKRVFDEADVLTGVEEENLEILIAKKEKQIACDIVIVTIDESLEEYAKSYENQIGLVNTEQYVMVYADNFYNEHKFGFDKPYGDGAIYVDNWYRESDGWCYSRLSTSGKVQNKYTDGMIQRLNNKVMDIVNENPYEAYKTYVNTLSKDMSGAFIGYDMPIGVILAFAVLVTAIYISVHITGNKGKKTTLPITYVTGGHPTMNVKEDALVSKFVTSRRIQTSSGGSGGGGGHTSAGGHSHGGGGGRH